MTPSAATPPPPAVLVRKPVGSVPAIRQPLYDLKKVDADFPCKQGGGGHSGNRIRKEFTR